MSSSIKIEKQRAHTDAAPKPGKRPHLPFLAVFLLLTAVFCTSCNSAIAPVPPADAGGGFTDASATPLVPGGPVLLQDAVYSTEAPAPKPLETPTPTPAPFPRIGDDLAVSRAMAAKMVALAVNDRLAIDTMERETVFPDVVPGSWYDKYVNAVYVQGYMSGTDKGFQPDEPLTLDQAQMLLDRVDPAGSVKIQMNIANQNRPVSYALWTELYQKLLVAIGCDAVAAEDFVVMATPGNNSQLKSGRVVTDAGPYTCAGLNMDAYADKRVQALIRDGEIVAVLSVTDRTPVIYSAYIVKNDATSVTVFSGGAERTYKYACEPAKGDVSGSICDIRIDGGTASGLKVISEKVTGTVARTNDAKLELKEKGEYPRDGNFKAYSVADGAVKWKSDKDILVGTDMAVFFLDNGVARAGVITKNIRPDLIRVAIGATGFSGLIHESVRLTATAGFTVTAGDTAEQFQAGEVFDADSLRSKGRMYVTTAAAGRIQLKSVSRAWPDGESPAYRGTIEIGVENGGYSIVNELPLEEYLCAVVPSEMPSSYGAEAAKVQAVTARSYAYNQIRENKYHAYGANVDDSVMCQVYNNIPENDVSRQAVDATRGLCLTYGGAVISANFFSTSAGVTANSGEVWASPSKEFPADTPVYLASQKQYTGADYGDLSAEDNARAFFTATDIQSYDAGFGWFRWNTVMSAEDIARSVDANLTARYNADPQMIKTLQNNGVYRSRPISTVGDVADLEVTERGAGGNIMEMKITGTKATILVRTEYNVRALLRPSGDVSLKNGSKVSGYSIMPSAFFVIDKTYDGDKMVSVKFYGGGNGHGAGMSQNGVKGMIGAGFGFGEILAHYYPGTELTQVQ